MSKTVIKILPLILLLSMFIAGCSGHDNEPVSYIVNKNSQPNGDHEVHRSGCSRMPYVSNRLYLGEFNNCYDAVAKAREYYSQADGCYFCSRDCHTG
jgi:hypothetical protein